MTPIRTELGRRLAALRAKIEPNRKTLSDEELEADGCGCERCLKFLAERRALDDAASDPEGGMDG